MDWLSKMLDAVNYMERHMEEPHDISKIARVACSSIFHFQRMFHMLTGSTVVEYVRRRKLTLAAQELASSNVRVLDVALKYGYETPESFAKAFRRMHGISPSGAREPGVSLKAFPRISFQISLKGDKDMDYRIVERGAFKIVGKELKVSTKGGENRRRIPLFWTECNKDGTSEKLCTDFKSQSMLGVCMDMEHDKEQFTYMVALEGGDGYSGREFSVKTVPEATWAVFTSVGPMPQAIQEVWNRIFQEWFPATGYEHADAPELEVYPEGDMSRDDYRCEVWIPIVKK